MPYARLFAIAALLGACVESPAFEPVEAPSPATPASPKVPVCATSLRGVDWGNLMYEGLEPSTFRLHDGRSEIHEYMTGHGTAHTTELWMLDAVAYGDIGGDGNEDAAVAISYQYYGYGADSHALDVVAFALVDGQVTQIARATLAPGRVGRLVIAHGEITVVYSDRPETRRLRFDSGELVPVR